MSLAKISIITFPGGSISLYYGFPVFLTSAHGNLQPRCIGQPKESAIAYGRGERVRYPDPVLKAEIKSEFHSAIEWQPLGLPEQDLPLLVPKRKALIGFSSCGFRPKTNHFLTQELWRAVIPSELSLKVHRSRSDSKYKCYYQTLTDFCHTTINTLKGIK